MRLLLVIETPPDDDLHWTRIAKALYEYCDQVRANHDPKWDWRQSSLGCDGGPNLFRTSMPGVSITELRVDLPFFRQVIGDRFPKLRRLWWRLCWLWWRLCCWWLHSLLNPYAIEDRVEERADGSLVFTSVRRRFGDKFPRARSAWGRLSGWWSRISA